MKTNGNLTHRLQICSTDTLSSRCWADIRVHGLRHRPRHFPYSSHGSSTSKPIRRPPTIWTFQSAQVALNFSNMLPLCSFASSILHFYCRLRSESRFISCLDSAACALFPKLPFCNSFKASDDEDVMLRQKKDDSETTKETINQTLSRAGFNVSDFYAPKIYVETTPLLVIASEEWKSFYEICREWNCIITLLSETNDDESSGKERRQEQIWVKCAQTIRCEALSSLLVGITRNIRNFIFITRFYDVFSS